MFRSQIGGLALNRRKWSEMGPEWSPGPENRTPACHGHFQASGTSPVAKIHQKAQKLLVWGLALGLSAHQHTGEEPLDNATLADSSILLKAEDGEEADVNDDAADDAADDAEAGSQGFRRNGTVP